MPDVAPEFLDEPRNRVERRQATHGEPRSKEDFPRRMRSAIASQYLRIVHGVKLSPNTLAKMRVLGSGPKFRKYGRWPTYDDSDLDEFSIERLGSARRSTSE